jgi:hypothetical protein
MTEYAQARFDVDKQLEQVKRIGASGSSAGVERETAVLHALIARESAALTMHMASEWARNAEVFRETVEKGGGKIEGAFDRAVTATDASTKRLTDWTERMAWATIALAVSTVALVGVTLLAWLRPH